MPCFEKKTALCCTALELYNWHMQPSAFEDLTPPDEKITVISRPEIFGDGAKIELQICAGPMRISWIALHENFIEGGDLMISSVRGPLKSGIILICLSLRQKLPVSCMIRFILKFQEVL